MKFNFDECEQPLANIGSIQDFGALAWIDKKNNKISFMSKNFPEFIGIPKEDIQKKTVADMFNIELDRQLHHTGEAQYSIEYYKKKRAIIREYFDGWLMEWEPEYRDLLIGEIEPLKLTSKLSESEAIQQTLQYIHELSGFEQVLFYQFLPDGTGEVTAEINHGARDNYFGLRYPATDIPQVARKIYIQNPYRYIYNVNGSNYKISCLQDDLPASHIDLTHSFLRSVSPFHIEYLKNMRVACAFSLSLVQDKKLTGLISLHHNSPKVLPYFIRESLAKAVKEYNLFIRNKNIGLRMSILDKHQSLVRGFLNSIAKPLASSESTISNLIEIIEADGLAYTNGSNWNVFGNTPSVEVLNALSIRFQKDSPEGFFQTDSLSMLLSQVQIDITQAAGVLAVWFHCNFTNKTVFCMFFKKESIQEVTWGSKVSVAPGKLHPVNSFGRWNELMSGHSKPWSSFAILTVKTILSQKEFYNDHA